MFNIDEMISDLVSETSGGGTSGVYEDIIIDSKLLVKGHRNNVERIELFNHIIRNDIKDKSVIDFGCNLGTFCNYFKDTRHCNKVVGIEKNPKFFKWAKVITPEAQFINADLNMLNSQDIARQTGVSQFDIVLILAVWDYMEEAKFAQMIRSVAKDTIYFEGHADGARRIYEAIPYQGKILKSYKDILENVLKVKEYSLINFVDNGQRPLFSCKI